MAKFTAGDKVRKKDGTSFSNRDFVLTVDLVDATYSDARVWFTETGTNLPESLLELVRADEGDKAVLPKEIADALEALRNKEGGFFTEERLVNVGTFLNAKGVIESIGGDRLKVAEWLAEDVITRVPVWIDAVLNGCKVELTPKQELEQLAKEYASEFDECLLGGMVKTGHQYLGRAKGIREAIDFLTERGVL